MGKNSSNTICDFVRGHIISHGKYYVFYSRKGIRHYEIYPNTPHEGSINGLKYSASPALPCHSLVEYHEIQVFQDAKKQVVMEKE
eukprot:905212-Ditylum_brightwellii.AAC.1